MNMKTPIRTIFRYPEGKNKKCLYFPIGQRFSNFLNFKSFGSSANFELMGFIFPITFVDVFVGGGSVSVGIGIGNEFNEKCNINSKNKHRTELIVSNV